MMKGSRIKLLAAGSFTYVVAVTAGYYYSTINKHEHHPTITDQTTSVKSSSNNVQLEDTKRQQTYAKLAHRYDQEIGSDEVVMGLSLIRWWNIRKAKGNVLEIGCGTGRNFPYYNFQAIDSLTAIDSVKEMIEVSKTKLPSSPSSSSSSSSSSSTSTSTSPSDSSSKEGGRLGGGSEGSKKKIQLLQMNAHHLHFPDNSFDYVIDTFGLCSYDNPKQVLSEMVRVLNKANPSARILFIEHGQASYDWLNRILQAQAQHHADQWGCIWNLNIEQLLLSTQLLDIVSISRYHFGTTYVIEARASQSPPPPRPE